MINNLQARFGWWRKRNICTEAQQIPKSRNMFFEYIATLGTYDETYSYIPSVLLFVGERLRPLIEFARLWFVFVSFFGLPSFRGIFTKCCSKSSDTQACGLAVLGAARHGHDNAQKFRTEQAGFLYNIRGHPVKIRISGPGGSGGNVYCTFYILRKEWPQSSIESFCFILD